MEKLWNMGTLVQIQASVWSMETHLEAEDIEKDKREIPDFVRLGYKRLFSKEVKNNFNRIVGKARNTARRQGFDFFLTGAYFVPNSTLPDVLSTLNTLQPEFRRTVDSFIERYDMERDSFLNKYPTYRSNLVPFYPTKEEVRNKFGFNVYCYKISSSAMTTDEALFLSQNVYVDWATQALNQLRKEARNVVLTLEKEIGDNTLDGRSVRRVQTLVRRLADLDLSKDTELLGAAKAVALGPTLQNLSQLQAKASDLPPIRIRKLLFD